MAAEETQRIEKQQWPGNVQATTVGSTGAMAALTSTNVQQQRRRKKTAGKRLWMNNNGTADKQQQSMVEDNGSCLEMTKVEDRLKCGGGGSTMAWQRRID